MSVTAYIALGSNLGDRAANLQQALALLPGCGEIQVTRVSSFHETDPVGGPPGQGRYLNAAAELQTTLSASDLLRTLLDVEKKLGRVRLEKDGPRTLDLDLLLYGQDVLDLKKPDLDLRVPHPRLHERLFVLEPLAEIAGGMVHPVLLRTVAELLRQLRAPNGCRELAGLRALVTGSTSGIGRAIALELAAGGADVLVHGRRSPDAEAAARGCAGFGVRSQFLLTDLRDEEKLLALVPNAWSIWNGLDIWINNAGADTLTGESLRWSFTEKLQALWEVDVRATMVLARAVGERMREQGRGVILTMGWDQADSGMEGDSGQLFGAAKGAVMAFTKSLAIDLAPLVRVNCLAPGWIRTAWGEKASAPWQERVRRETPLQRWGTPDDVARAARWLVSPGASFITGQIIRVNGGAVRG
ncbi:MAG TPA: 2-amino-4-hydroxy-6-hydroxymethyldihydropteridine diphosphokinase [Gemmataceae bacterium]|jgi:3-oxoacyl-[acyl-carrier protein] reductase|nr:2-amino-4-hydroxy-6-hydroxymethyldihydropteridine diphosphokinase [Gemmataceae bacterium]